MKVFGRIADVFCFVIGPILFSIGLFGGFSFDPKVTRDLMALRQGKMFSLTEDEILSMAIGVGLINPG